MRNRIIAGLVATLGLAAASSADAAVWRWGCQGTLGTEKIAYNRDSLIVTPAKPPRGTIDQLIFKDDLGETPDDIKNSYKNDSGELSFAKTTTFTHTSDPKRTVTLTEKSSRRISYRHKLICGRDEETETTRKIYGYQRNGEPARDITMQCMEYQLSTAADGRAATS